MSLPFLSIYLLLVGCFVESETKAQDSLFLVPLAKNGKFNSSEKYTSSNFLAVDKKDSIKITPVQSRVPLNFYSTHLGTACKMELQLEKQTRLPIRIRLGSKEQVDYLEGKFSRSH